MKWNKLRWFEVNNNNKILIVLSYCIIFVDKLWGSVIFYDFLVGVKGILFIIVRWY